MRLYRGVTYATLRETRRMEHAVIAETIDDAEARMLEAARADALEALAFRVPVIVVDETAEPQSR